MPQGKRICWGLLERIGSEDSRLTYESETTSWEETTRIEDHKAGLEAISQALLSPEKGSIKSADDIDAVGHRVVHGGSSFTATTVISEAVKKKIEEVSPMAPLHNPHNLSGIRLAEKLFPNAVQVAVFDTAFHQTMPEKAYRYAIPEEFYKEQGVRAYGFHGTSHQYVSRKAMDYLGNKEARIVSLHLGNGCSATAIKAGKSIDHSLGFGPSNGLVMGSRAGDIDQSVVFYMISKLGYTPESLKSLLDKGSGYLGMTGHSDLRDIQEAAAGGDDRAKLALELSAYRIRKYIGAYSAAMNGLEALIFTAGIGENSSVLRAMVCEDMDYLGIAIDANKNEERSRELRSISAAGASVEILVIPTDEELEIAGQAYTLLDKDR